MCGRARCTLASETLAQVSRVPQDRWIDTDKYHPSYNVTPGRYAPVVRMVRQKQVSVDGHQRQFAGTNGDEGKGPADGNEEVEESGTRERTVQFMKWGLVPSFNKKTDKPDHFRMFNARSESVHEKSSFRRLLPWKRCLAFVEGFYEWKKDGKQKQPYYIHLASGQPLVFAALYDRWEDEGGEALYTYTILTTRVSKRLEWLHDRMPVILPNEEAVQRWLEGDLKHADIADLAQPYDDSDLVWHAVTPAMGKPSFDGPDCVKELKNPGTKSSAIAQLFQKQRGGATAGKGLAPEERHAGVEAAQEAAPGKAKLGKAEDAQEGEEQVGNSLRQLTWEERKALEAGVEPDRDVTADVEETAREQRRQGRGGGEAPPAVGEVADETKLGKGGMPPGNLGKVFREDPGKTQSIAAREDPQLPVKLETMFEDDGVKVSKALGAEGGRSRLKRDKTKRAEAEEKRSAGKRTKVELSAAAGSPTGRGQGKGEAQNKSKLADIKGGKQSSLLAFFGKV